MTATPGVVRRAARREVTRVIASLSAEVWNGFETTSAAPARKASTAPATDPCAVSASVVTAGRHARAFMITAAPSSAGSPRSTTTSVNGDRPRRAIAPAALVLAAASKPIGRATPITTAAMAGSLLTTRIDLRIFLLPDIGREEHRLSGRAVDNSATAFRKLDAAGRNPWPYGRLPPPDAVCDS